MHAFADVYIDVFFTAYLTRKILLIYKLSYIDSNLLVFKLQIGPTNWFYYVTYICTNMTG